MKHFLTIYLVLTFWCSMSFAQILSPEQIFEKVDNSIVVIIAYNNSKAISQGSGVVINDIGNIVTNYHVISGCNSIEVKHYNKTIKEVQVQGIDVQKDIAILKISDNTFSAINIANTSSLKTGQKVFAIGSPMGLENTISEGIISGLRYTDDLGRELIQISASISPGSSGGAVVNSNGELIGISTSSIKEGQNLNFAINAKYITNIITSNIDSKELELSAILIQANELSIKGHPSDAIILYNDYIKKKSKGLVCYTPDFAPVYLYRGRAYGALKRYDEAIKDFIFSISLDKNNPLAYYFRGLTYIYQAKETNNISYSKAYYRTSILDFNKAIDLDPYFIDAYYHRALSYALIDNCDKAVRDLYKIISLDNSYEDALKPLINGCK